MSVTRDLQLLEADVGELIARHQNARTTTSFAKYKGKPVEFMRAELNFFPYPKQVEVCESFVANKKSAVRGFHGAGKEAVFGALMLYAAYVEGMLVLCISATERQLLGQLWREVGNRFSDRLPGELYTSDLRIGGKKRILAMTSNNTSSLTGWHDPHGVAIFISEGQGEQVEATAFDAAIANAVDDQSRIAVAGNPIKPEGRFYEACRSKAWHSIKISAFDHPNISGVGTFIPGGPAKDWPQQIAEEFGETSAWYIARVLAEFPETGIDSVFRRSWIDKAIERGKLPGWKARTSLNTPLIIADIARAGPDSTCWAVGRGPALGPFESMHEPDLMETAKLLHAKAVELGFYRLGVARPTPEQVEACAAEIVLDDNGVGGGCTDRIRELRGRVRPFNGARKAKNEGRFANVRAESYWTLREKLQRDAWSLPDDPQLVEDLLATAYTENGAGKIILIPKEEIRAKLGRSPDKGDVAAMHAHQLHASHKTIVTTYR